MIDYFSPLPLSSIHNPILLSLLLFKAQRHDASAYGNVTPIATLWRHRCCLAQSPWRLIFVLSHVLTGQFCPRWENHCKLLLMPRWKVMVSYSSVSYLFAYRFVGFGVANFSFLFTFELWEVNVMFENILLYGRSRSCRCQWIFDSQHCIQLVYVTDDNLMLIYYSYLVLFCRRIDVVHHYSILVYFVSSRLYYSNHNTASGNVLLIIRLGGKHSKSFDKASIIRLHAQMST